MKPLRLSMTAFGPYAACQTLDFAELREAGFFLIHGPTGGGKTTILDAVCFALFGETSGNGRDGSQMRSQFAASELLTSIRFDFQLRDVCYRIERAPEQVVAKKRGTGTTTKPTAATLWKSTAPDPGSGDEGWSVVETHPSRVTAAIEGLLGFSVRQFRQVIVLPQGRFRELLEANSKQREEILETLFQTERFSLIAERLKSQAKELEQSHQTLESERKALLAQAAVANVEELDAKCEGLRVESATVRGRLDVAEAEQQQLEAELSALRLDAAQFVELDAARAAVESLAARADEHVALRQRLDAARRAEAVRPVAKQADDAEAGCRRLTAELESLHAARTAATTELERARTALEVERQQEPQRVEWRSRLAGLKELRPLLDDWLTACEKERATHEVERIANQSREKHDADLAKLNERRQQIEADVKRNEQDSAALPGLLAERERAASALLTIQTRARLRGSIAQQAERVTAAEAAREAAESRLHAVEERLAEEQAEWDSGQAALLASQLKPNEPCPVCGATHHPQPAVSPSGKPPSETTLKKLRKDVETARKEWNDAKEATLQQRGLLVEQEAEVQALPETTGDEAQGQETLKQLDTRIATLRAAAEQVAALQQEADSLRRQLEEHKQKSATVQAEWEQARATTQRAVATTETLAGRLPESLRDADTLQAEIDQWTRKLDASDTALREADAALQQSDKAASNLNVRWESSERLLGEAALLRENARIELASALAEHSFADLEAWRAALIEKDELRTWEQTVDAFDQDRAVVADRLQRAEAAVADRARPDIASCEGRLTAIKASVAADLKRHSDVRARLDLLTNLRDKLIANSEQMASLDERYAVVGRVAEAVNGKNELGLTLQRFVLAAFLDDVLIAASARLHRMSRGRYAIARKEGRENRRAAAGLDLVVSDEFTGQSRDVATLSGGEGFLASLSLALGLADVVQSYSGGLRLDTLFIDEGFGTLDPEALDQAINILMDLQEGGRLVGIISHVPELRERIDVRLEITAARHGSTARFVVP